MCSCDCKGTKEDLHQQPSAQSCSTGYCSKLNTRSQYFQLKLRYLDSIKNLVVKFIVHRKYYTVRFLSRYNYVKTDGNASRRFISFTGKNVGVNKQYLILNEMFLQHLVYNDHSISTQLFLCLTMSVFLYKTRRDDNSPTKIRIVKNSEKAVKHLFLNFIHSSSPFLLQYAGLSPQCKRITVGPLT